jgi:LysR family hydrogen peroxide-inducible transcriptional activator
LLLLEEGHCMRDQALTFCNLRRIENIETFGASSLSTLVQMVANGLGLTLLPEISLETEVRKGGLNVMRFSEPEPSRTLGLAWRTTSPRKAEFVRFGQLITAVRPKPYFEPA